MSNRLQVNKFLEDMSFNSRIRILEEAKDKDKLMEIATKKGIQLPAHDLAIFECIYAYTDRQNKNGCTLPKEEVEKALPTLAGKSIDLDHFRKRVVGHWVDAKIEGDEIRAYGVFFKGSFNEDYEIAKELFDKGNLAVSFEAWGDRIYKDKDKKQYDLTDIEFAGGALLIKTEPAFDGAGVLEMAKKDRVLEMAKVMTAPKSFVQDKIEKARYYSHDMDSVIKAMSQVPCAGCDEMYSYDPMMIDFANNKAKTKCVSCGTEMMLDLTPQATVTKKGRQVKSATEIVKKASIENIDELVKEFEGADDALAVALEESALNPTDMPFSERANLKDDDFAVVKIINLGEDKTKKIRMFPIHDLVHICASANRLEQSQVRSMLDKLGVTQDNMDRKILRKATCIIMKSLLEKYKKNSVGETIQEIAKTSISRELTQAELEKAYSIVEYKATGGKSDAASLLSLKGKSTADPVSLQNANVTEEDVKLAIAEATKPAEVKSDPKDAELASLKAALAEATTKLAGFEAEKAATETARKAALVKARRDELTEEFAKDLKDEDVLDETKFELAKLKKENAELKAKSGKPATAAVKPALTKGSDNKNIEDSIVQSRQLVDKYAFGESKSDEE